MKSATQRKLSAALAERERLLALLLVNGEWIEALQVQEAREWARGVMPAEGERK
jgi:hypothetical protein